MKRCASTGKADRLDAHHTSQQFLLRSAQLRSRNHLLAACIQ
jgi:hypothetical protein